ncbi:M16 family metallopeptidase [Candidatus Tisiphia endosymbiont of Psammoecus bipunctatus]|uniref:M16 family metallopeptidase n=1 Tax=Candidatus Tisiphia endosymbiont of Psammoecus bipunctatus TaxID=3139333 RepID=UPI0035C8BD32
MTFNSSKLKNGLTILTYNMSNVNSVAINVIVNVGSRYEQSSEIGISHFLEHMAFKGTTTRSAKQIAEEFDSIGGHFNAYTSHEQTVYYSKILNENCYKALEILADIIQNSVFSKEEIAKEYQVILQEIAHVQDNPDELIHEKFYSSAYENQALGRSILGTHDSLAKFDREHFSNYVDKHYNAENIYLSVAGNISHEQVVEFAKKLFCSLKNKQNSHFEKVRYTGGHSFITKDLEQTTLVLGFESVPYFNIQQLYHTQVLSLILGSGMSSRLFQQIREKLGLVYSIGSYNNSYYDSGIFGIYASTNHDKLPFLAEQLVNEIKKISTDIKDSEIDRAKVQLKTSIYIAQEESSYKSEEIGKNFAVFGKYIPTEQTIEYIMNITKQDIINIANKIFVTKPTLSIIDPKPLAIDYQELCHKLAL